MRGKNENIVKEIVLKIVSVHLFLFKHFLEAVEAGGRQHPELQVCSNFSTTLKLTFT